MLQTKPAIKPGARVILAQPDDIDLRQGLSQGLVGTVLEYESPYYGVVMVRFDAISDDYGYAMEMRQLEVVNNDTGND